MTGIRNQIFSVVCPLLSVFCIKNMRKVKVLVLYGHGINCDNETKKAFELAGACVEKAHTNELIEGSKKLDSYDILAFPGGFSFGDDIAAGKIHAVKFKYKLKKNLLKFISDKKLIIGICNGFQIMVKLGFLPGINDDYWTQKVTLAFNDSGKFEDRWVNLKVEKSPCVFTKGIKNLYLPIRHGEGKFYAEPKTLAKLKKENLIVLRYANPNGEKASKYPHNPNGSLDNIAGICDPSGRIFGLMPHPEAYIYRENHPKHTRETLPEKGVGLAIFENAVKYVKENL